MNINLTHIGFGLEDVGSLALRRNTKGSCFQHRPILLADEAIDAPTSASRRDDPQILGASIDREGLVVALGEAGHRRVHLRASSVESSEEGVERGLKVAHGVLSLVDG